MATTEGKLQELVNAVGKASERFGLSLNAKKTQVMVIGRHTSTINIMYNGAPLEQVKQFIYLGASFNEKGDTIKEVNLFPLIPACTARPGLPLSPPETAFLESPYYRPQTASIADRHHPTNFHSVTYTQTDDAAFEAGSDNDHKSFLRMRVIFKVEYPAELFRFRRVLDDILSSFDVF